MHSLHREEEARRCGAIFMILQYIKATSVSFEQAISGSACRRVLEDA
jgi:hypothetical protein